MRCSKDVFVWRSVSAHLGGEKEGRARWAWMPVGDGQEKHHGTILGRWADQTLNAEWKPINGERKDITGSPFSGETLKKGREDVRVAFLGCDGTGQVGM